MQTTPRVYRLQISEECNLEETAACLYKYSLEIGLDVSCGRGGARSRVLIHTDKTLSVVTHLVKVTTPMLCGFQAVDDYMRLASFRTWTAQLPLFMKLASFHHHLSEIRESAKVNLIRKSENLDALYWTFWLRRLGLNHFETTHLIEL